MTCSAYIQLQCRKVFTVFNLQKILSLQSRTQMIILFLALVGFITFFFADDDNILSYRQGISISWLDWSTTDSLAQVILRLLKKEQKHTPCFKSQEICQQFMWRWATLWSRSSSRRLSGKISVALQTLKRNYLKK